MELVAISWEPRSNAADWAFAHHMTTIGEGYVWPNITIFSDGERTAFISRPTTDRPGTAFRYISDYAAILPSPTFESAVDQLVSQLLGQLQAEGTSGTNLQRLWSELQINVGIATRHSVASWRHCSVANLMRPTPGQSTAWSRTPGSLANGPWKNSRRTTRKAAAC